MIMNTLLTVTINNKEVLINLDNVTCFVKCKDNTTLVWFNDDSRANIKAEFDDIVKELHRG